jgi:hypothetical protein
MNTKRRGEPLGRRAVMLAHPSTTAVPFVFAIPNFNALSAK